MGFFPVVTLPTVPACSESPCMIKASSSFLPSVVKTKPLPALNTVVSSVMTIAASMASIALPPILMIAFRRGAIARVLHGTAVRARR